MLYHTRDKKKEQTLQSPPFGSNQAVQTWFRYYNWLNTFKPYIFSLETTLSKMNAFNAPNHLSSDSKTEPKCTFSFLLECWKGVWVDRPPTCKTTEVWTGNYSLIWSGLTPLIITVTPRNVSSLLAVQNSVHTQVGTHRFITTHVSVSAEPALQTPAGLWYQPVESCTAAALWGTLHFSSTSSKM